MQGLIRKLANMVERADRAAEAHRKGPRMVVWDPDLRRGAATGAYCWEDGGRAVYKGFWKDTERRVNRERLEAIRSFLNYVVRTYPWMNPYVKGLHLTIEGWRPGRVAGGWRDNWRARSKPSLHMPARRAWDTRDEEARQEEGTEDQEAPATVAVQPRLRSDIRCLLQLTAPRTPPRERYRAGSTSVAYYMPGDASGKGFGSALIGPDRITYHAGTWAKEWRDESSNFREADNLVLKVEDLVKEGTMQDQELFLFTDNWVFENCYYKGHSASKKLSDVILRLYLAQRNGRLRLHVTHVTGTRMKAVGVDGLSRGDYLEGLVSLSNLSSTRPRRWHLEFAQRTRLESMSGDSVLQSLLTNLTCIIHLTCTTHRFHDGGNPSCMPG